MKKMKEKGARQILEPIPDNFLILSTFNGNGKRKKSKEY